MHGRDRDLGARKELCPLAGLRDEIGLGEGLDQALFLQRGNQGVDPEPVGIDHLRQQRAERRERSTLPRRGKTPLLMGAADAASSLGRVRGPVDGCWRRRLLFAEFDMAPNPETPIPFLFPAKKFTPRSRPAVRSTSRKRTFSITCWEGATFIALMTGESFPRYYACGDFNRARRRATASLASPLSTTCPFALETLMFPAGAGVRSCRAVRPCPASPQCRRLRSCACPRRTPKYSSCRPSCPGHRACPRSSAGCRRCRASR